MHYEKWTNPRWWCESTREHCNVIMYKIYNETKKYSKMLHVSEKCDYFVWILYKYQVVYKWLIIKWSTLAYDNTHQKYANV